MKKKYFIIIIVFILLLNLFAFINRILLVNSEDKKSIINLHNLPNDSKILLVKGSSGLLLDEWPITVYYINNFSIEKQVLYDGNESSETHGFAVDLYKKNIVKEIWLYELIIITLSLIICYIYNKKHNIS